MSNNDLIPWSKDLTLTWKNFNGSIDESKDYRVESSIKTDYHWEFNFVNDSKQIRFTKFIVEPFFEKSRSWAMKNTITDEENDRLLKHELGHFDIGVLWSNILKGRLEKSLLEKIFDCKGESKKEREKFGNKLAKKLVNEIYEKWDLEYSKEHDDYDERTNHADIVPMQLQYDKEFDEVMGRQ